MLDPIRRYIKGFDPALLDEVVGYLVTSRGGAALTAQEESDLSDILGKHEYYLPFGAMPIAEGIEHARFLAELVVSHYRFTFGAPVVGGQVNVGMVTYRGGRFQMPSYDA